jgi:hypothetical protein
MKGEQDYIQDIAAIRALMERSTKFLSLSGLAGVMAGVYALSGTYIAWQVFDFRPEIVGITPPPAVITKVIAVGIIVLVLAVTTAILLSRKKADKQHEKFWNPVARRLVVNMAVPLVAGGLLILILIAKGMYGLMIPVSLIFYGVALFTAGKFTYDEIKSLGLMQIALGLISAYFVEYGIFLWAIGFGILHIIYGIYMHYKYER